MIKYSISEIASETGLTASTLRYYEEIGLLPNVERNLSKQRVYTQKHLDRLHAINCFKDAGMSIASIQKFFHYEDNGHENIAEIMNLLKTQQEESLLKMQSEIAAYAHLLRKIDYYQAIRNSIDQHTKQPEWSDFQDRDCLQQVKIDLNL